MRDAFVGVGASDAPALTPLYRQYWAAAGQGGSVGKLSCVVRLANDRPSTTLQKSGGSGDPFHPTECRAVSTPERRRLRSYPDGFRFTDWRGAVQRIGNSVPPLLMRSIARHVRTLVARG